MRPRNLIKVEVCGVLSRDAELKPWDDGSVTARLLVDYSDEERVRIEYRLGKKPAPKLLEYVKASLLKGARIWAESSKWRTKHYTDKDGKTISYLCVYVGDVKVLDFVNEEVSAIEKEPEATSQPPPTSREDGRKTESHASPPPAQRPRLIRSAPAVPVSPAPEPPPIAPRAAVNDAVPFDSVQGWDN